MSRYIRFLLAIVAVFAISMQVDGKSTLRFVVGNNVCTPITVKCQGRTYTVYSSLDVESTQSSTSVTAYDCNGIKLKYDFSSSGSRGGNHIYTYTFKNDMYYQNQSNSNSSSSGGSILIPNSR